MHPAPSVLGALRKPSQIAMFGTILKKRGDVIICDLLAVARPREEADLAVIFTDLHDAREPGPGPHYKAQPVLLNWNNMDTILRCLHRITHVGTETIR